MADESRDDAGEAQVQQAAEKHAEQGFIGTEVDPTPNAHYTVSGVGAGRPTPETDAKAAAKAKEATRL